MTKPIVSFLLFFCAWTAMGQPLPLDSAIRTGKLENGFSYYIRKNTEPEKRVQLYLVIKAGSVLEHDDQRGLAHFMEHMSFNGTTHFPKNDLVHYLQKSGVRFGADLNAYTSFDETVYQLPIPTDDPVLLKNGLLIMRDWAGNATLDVNEINGERGVVLEEKRLGKGASERMQEKTLPVILNNSRYAERLPIGVDTVLENFNRKTILDFYTDWYRPDLQALIVVGDINVSQIEQQIKTLFSDLKNPVNERPRIKYTVPLTGKNNFITVTDKEFPYTVMQIMVKLKGQKLITLQDYEASVDRILYNQMLAGRIAEISHEPNPPFIEATAESGEFLGGLDAFTVTMVAKPGRLDSSFAKVWKLIQQVKQYGFTENEFERTKSDYLSSLANALHEKDKRNSQDLVQEYTRNFLTQEAAPGIEAEYEITSNYLKNAKLTDIDRLSVSFISDSNRDIILMAAQKDSASLPDQSTVNTWLQAISHMALQPYADPFANQELTSEDIKPGKIVKEVRIQNLGITELTLSNAAKVILKPTLFKNDEIRFAAFSPGGTSLYDEPDFQSATSAAGIVEASGISRFSPTDLQKMLSGKQLGVQPYIDERFSGIEGFSTSRDLETALQLMNLYFTSPRKDSTVFSNIIGQTESLIANRYSEPNNVFADTIAAVLGNYSYRRTGPSLKKLQEIDLDKVYRIYRERFAHAGNFVFIFTGNFNVDSIKLLLKKYIGSLPTENKREEARDLHIHIPPGKIAAIAYKGREPKASVRLVISGDYVYNPKNNIQLTALSEILQFHITDRLREKESGAYSPSVQVTFNKFPSNRYAFTIVFGCAPENIDKLIAASREEIANLKTNAVSAIDIRKFSSEESRQYEVHLKENDYWLNELENRYENGDDPAGILDYSKLIQKVTAASVRSAANLYLNENNFIKLILLPEKN
jgi:zinc protease